MIITLCVLAVTGSYHIFGLPQDMLDDREMSSLYGIRALAIVIIVIAVSFIGLGLLLASAVILMYDVVFLHFNNFDPNLVQNTNKKIKSEVLRLEQASEEATEKFAKYQSEKEKYETLNNQLSLTSSHLEERQAEIVRKEEFLSSNIGKLESQVSKAVEEERIRLEEIYEKRFKEKTDAFTTEMTGGIGDRIAQEKKAILNNVFSFDETSQDDSFEIKQFQDKLQKKEEDLEKKSFLAEVDQKIAEASTHSLEAKHTLLSMKSENVELKGDIKDLSHDLNSKIKDESHERKIVDQSLQHALEKEGMHREAAIKGVEFQIGELKHFLVHQIKELEMKGAKGLQQVAETITQVKMDLNNEVFRLDKQQQTVLIELEKYYTKNEKFIQKMQQLHLDAQQQKLNGEQILNKVNALHDKHEGKTKSIEQRLERSIDHLALKEGALANTLGESMLKLKQISDEQYNAMKDMSLEKKDIKLLHKEKNIEHELNLKEVKHAKLNLDQAKHEFATNKQNTLQNAKLTHQLYMKEQQYSQALFKERNSKGFLSRLASHFESK